MTNESPYIDDMIKSLEARLHVLEVQAAQMGIDAPPHVVTEIEQIKSRLEEITMGSMSLISVELLQRMEPVERWKRLYDSLWELIIKFHTLEKNVESDRLRLQSRHKDFNIAIQRNTIENEFIKRNQRLIMYAFIFLFLLIALSFFVRFNGI